MELILALIALVVAGGAAVVALRARATAYELQTRLETTLEDLAQARELSSVARRLAEAGQSRAAADREADDVRRELAALRDELAQQRGEVEQLRAGLEGPPPLPPPLPQGRRGNLEDLRERLRAEQAATTDEDDA